jgi:hypothetical protein
LTEKEMQTVENKIFIGLNSELFEGIMNIKEN